MSDAIPERKCLSDNSSVVAAGVAKLVVFYDVVAGMLPYRPLIRVGSRLNDSLIVEAESQNNDVTCMDMANALTRLSANQYRYLDSDTLLAHG